MNDSKKIYRILVINPGSTSTKLSMFENEKNLFTTDVFHDSSVLKNFPTINDQLDYRMEVVRNFLKDNHIDLTGVDAIVGRGGGCYSVSSGIYCIDDRLVQDTREVKGGLYHASMLGVQMANELHKIYGGAMFMMDPPVVDELCDLARITGVKGVYRRTACHALNLKETARRHAASMGKRYEDCNFIVCHIDGGITITAHQKGKMIDANDGGGGEGPFTPTRMGSMAVTDLIRNFSDKSPEEMRSLCSQTGGLSSHFGTSNSDTIHKMVEDGDPEATRVWNAMIYQVIKWIGSMSTVLKGKVDGILLTGGLLRFNDVADQIRESCEWIAPVSVYPGEFEQEAMAFGALRVLRGEEKARTYPGKPVWTGFHD
ncbi:MAG: butyrate kinase [Clostridia bacterium]|nr:butyrate kinase [Clostridia bacterium]MDY5554195.1 butyrate kinase [Blautia sp.]